MAKVKHPFDYLDEADHVRIDRWLSNPNPDVALAVKILGISEEELLQRLGTSRISPAISVENDQEMAFSRIVYELKGTRKFPLNTILEPLYKYFEEQLESGAIQLQTRRRRTYLFGSGTPEYIEATISLRCDKLLPNAVSEIARLIEDVANQGVEVSVKKFED